MISRVNLEDFSPNEVKLKYSNSHADVAILAAGPNWGFFPAASPGFRSVAANFHPFS